MLDTQEGIGRETGLAAVRALEEGTGQTQRAKDADQRLVPDSAAVHPPAACAAHRTGWAPRAQGSQELLQQPGPGGQDCFTQDVFPRFQVGNGGLCHMIYPALDFLVLLDFVHPSETRRLT